MVQSRLSNFQKRSQWKLPPSVIMKIMMMMIIITSLLDSPLAVDSVSLPLLLEDTSSSSSSPSSSVYNHIINAKIISAILPWSCSTFSTDSFPDSSEMAHAKLWLSDSLQVQNYIYLLLKIHPSQPAHP